MARWQLNMKIKSAERGFTLTEVLIAAMILFTVVATVSQVYQAAVTSGIKASRSVELSGVVPLLADTISFNLQQADPTQTISQQGIINDYQFTWTATVKDKAPPPPRYEFETERLITMDEKFYLWQVQLEVLKDDYQQQYGFTVLSWKGL